MNPHDKKCCECGNLIVAKNYGLDISGNLYCSRSFCELGIAFRKLKATIKIELLKMIGKW